VQCSAVSAAAAVQSVLDTTIEVPSMKKGKKEKRKKGK